MHLLEHYKGFWRVLPYNCSLRMSTPSGPPPMRACKLAAAANDRQLHMSTFGNRRISDVFQDWKIEELSPTVITFTTRRPLRFFQILHVLPKRERERPLKNMVSDAA